MEEESRVTPRKAPQSFVERVLSNALIRTILFTIFVGFIVFFGTKLGIISHDMASKIAGVGGLAGIIWLIVYRVVGPDSEYTGIDYLWYGMGKKEKHGALFTFVLVCYWIVLAII